jgi:hypothetical protein
MSSTTLKDLPNEIITKVLSYLDTRDMFFFGHLSTRARAISRDKALWQKVTVYNKTLKSEFLEFMLRNGCKFLKLTDVQLKGSLHLRKSSILSDLSLDRCAIKNQVLEELLGSCHSLTKLKLRDMDVSDVNIKSLKKFVLKNKKTLQKLDLRTSKWLNLESIQFIVNNFTELTEVNLTNGYAIEDVLSEQSINYLANNLTEKVVKLNLGNQIFVEDEHVMKLIQRCKRLTEMSLNGTSISYNSLMCIIENLKHTLVILSLCNTDLSFDEILKLKAMPKLKVLNCSHLTFLPMDYLKEQYPNFNDYQLLSVAFSVKGFKITTGSSLTTWEKLKDLFILEI